MNSLRLFTIKEAALRTGLSTQLIRKWEERYEAVTPRRMPNGYRGYTERDLQILMWLKARVDEEMPIGMAVMELKASGGIGSQTGADTRGLQQSVEELVKCLLRLDASGAKAIFAELNGAYDPETLLTKLLHPILIELGERWERGEISEYQEHFGSHFVRDKVLALCSRVYVPPGSPLIVTSCGPGERHELGILYLGFFALHQGLQVAYLGASPSEKGIMDCLKEMKPAAFCFSFSTTDRFEAAVPFLTCLDGQITDQSLRTKVFLGGQGVPQAEDVVGFKHTIVLSGSALTAVQCVKREIGLG